MRERKLNLEGRKALEDARRRVAQFQTDLLNAQAERDEAIKTYREERDRRMREGEQYAIQGKAREVVLLGDRDALTRALEVCTRRLASPTAEMDPSRGGWRSANMLAPAGFQQAKRG